MDLTVADLGFKNFYGNSENTIHLQTEGVNSIAPGCETGGRTPDRTCKICGAYQEGGPAEPTGHIYAEEYTIDKKASPTENGSKSRHCIGKDCEERISVTTIPKMSTMTLSVTKYTYNGNAKKPTATVKNSSGTKLTKNTHYTVSYKNNTKVGKATVTITGKGNYKGTITKTFKINPKPTKITSLTKGSRSFTVKWSKVTTQTNGYQIYYTTSTTRKNGKTYTVTSNKTTSKKFTGLKSKKKYYVWVRTYKTVNGTKYYSTWSARDYITTK